MSIPELQLETWSHQGSVTQSANTYNTIKNALKATDTQYASHDFKVFLQGSYGNDTNIWAESDVDIVIQLRDTFYSDTTDLNKLERSLHKIAFPTATYTLADFKRDVFAALKKKYGDDIEEGVKAIACKANGSRRKADVIVAAEYRRYIKFNGLYDTSYAEGILFFDTNGVEIINYPKSHSVNLTLKHQNTYNRFKPTIRVLKNLRSKLIDEGLIEAGVAPSYYIEGLLYNVPDDLFTCGYADRLAKILTWLQGSDKDNLLCANEQYYLLRNFSPVTWRRAKCQEFINAAIDLWNKW